LEHREVILGVPEYHCLIRIHTQLLHQHAGSGTLVDAFDNHIGPSGRLWYQIEVRDRRYYCLEDLITLYIRVKQNPRLGIGNIGKGLADARALPFVRSEIAALSDRAMIVLTEGDQICVGVMGL
jgi:hypothetical protein